MFKFDFSKNNSINPIEELECKEIIQDDTNNYERENIKLCGFEFGIVKRDAAFKNLSQDQTRDENVAMAEESGSDLIAGGLQLWECTFDLSNYLVSSKIDLKNKTVLDLGCGSGLLGILAYKLGAASVHFQDYNEGVIKHWTIPNTKISGYSEKSKFYSGDWNSYCSKTQGIQFDIILTSETIYNTDNYQKLHKLLQLKLKPGGEIFLAGKSYYFGVGGSMRIFEELVEQIDIFKYKSLWLSDSGVKREIIRLSFKLN